MPRHRERLGNDLYLMIDTPVKSRQSQPVRVCLFNGEKVLRSMTIDDPAKKTVESVIDEAREWAGSG